MELLYLQKLVYFTVGLITILNPLAAAAIMVSLLGSKPSKDEVEGVSRKASLTVFTASVITVFTGDLIFRVFGINLPSIKVIGGIVLLVLALDMIQGKISKTKHSQSESQEAKEKEDISIVPLGIPILFGPGVITTLIVFKVKNPDTVSLILLVFAIFISSFATYLVLKNGYLLVKVLGITGLKIATRIMGLIVGAIAAEFLVSGIKSLWMGS